MEQSGEHEMKSDVQLLYEEKFRALLENTETQHELKNEVFATISKIEGLTSIVDLFTGKFAQSQIDLLNTTCSTKIDE